MQSIQDQLHLYPERVDLAANEQDASHTLHMLTLEMESALCHKAKMKWVQLGDDDSRYFHQSIKHRQRVNITHLHLKGEDITDPFLIQA